MPPENGKLCKEAILWEPSFNFAGLLVGDGSLIRIVARSRLLKKVVGRAVARPPSPSSTLEVKRRLDLLVCQSGRYRQFRTLIALLELFNKGNKIRENEKRYQGKWRKE